jgi:hypothetical protein
MSVKDTDMLLGPVPEQWKPENQSPDVAYTQDMQTGVKTYFDARADVEPEPEHVDEPEAAPVKNKGGRPKKITAETAETAVQAEE